MFPLGDSILGDSILGDSILGDSILGGISRADELLDSAIKLPASGAVGVLYPCLEAPEKH